MKVINVTCDRCDKKYTLPIDHQEYMIIELNFGGPTILIDLCKTCIDDVVKNCPQPVKDRISYWRERAQSEAKKEK